MPSRQQVALIFIGTLAWISFIQFYGSNHHTIKNKWQDNVSNICAAELFSLVGLDIYRTPPKDLLTKIPADQVPADFQPEMDLTSWFTHPKLGPERPLFFAWPWVPRPYPVGAWLWYSPYAAAVYHGGVSIGTATLAQCFIFLLLAHLCFFLFYNFLQSHFEEERLQKKYSFFKTSLIFLYMTMYLEFVWWSAEGQYDLIAMIPLFFSLMMYQQKKYTKAMFFFGVAMNFHFRVLFASGMLLVCGYKILKSSRDDPESIFKIKNWKWHLPSLALGSFAALIFFWSSKYLTDASLFRGNEYHYSLLGRRGLWELVGFVFVAVLNLSWLAFRKQWDFFITFFLALMMMLLSPQICGWYTMFLFPYFLMIPKKSAQKKSIYYAVFAFYIFTASTFMKESPFDLHFFREFVESLQGQ